MTLRNGDEMTRFDTADAPTYGSLRSNRLKIPAARPIGNDYWAQQGFTSVTEVVPGRSYECAVEGKTFRIAAAQVLGPEGDGWTVMVDELQRTGNWYRLELSNDLPKIAQAADAVKIGAKMVIAFA